MAKQAQTEAASQPAALAPDAEKMIDLMAAAFAKAMKDNGVGVNKDKELELQELMQYQQQHDTNGNKRPLLKFRTVVQAGSRPIDPQMLLAEEVEILNKLYDAVPTNTRYRIPGELNRRIGIVISDATDGEDGRDLEIVYYTDGMSAKDFMLWRNGIVRNFSELIQHAIDGWKRYVEERRSKLLSQLNSAVAGAVDDAVNE